MDKDKSNNTDGNCKPSASNSGSDISTPRWVDAEQKSVDQEGTGKITGGQFLRNGPEPETEGCSEMVMSPQLDVTLGQLNAEDFLVPVGQPAVTAAKPTILPVRMPPKSAFFRAHPSKVIAGYLLDAEEDVGGKESPYLVLPRVAEKLNDPCVRLRHLYLAKTLQGACFLIPVSPNSTDPWTTSKLTVIDQARQRWLRAAAEKNFGGYSLTFPTVPLSEPDWKDTMSDRDIVNAAFNDRQIMHEDHPQLKRLRGEF
jgi:hypothetical protein